MQSFSQFSKKFLRTLNLVLILSFVVTNYGSIFLLPISSAEELPFGIASYTEYSKTDTGNALTEETVTQSGSTLQDTQEEQVLPSHSFQRLASRPNEISFKILEGDIPIGNEKPDGEVLNQDEVTAAIIDSLVTKEKITAVAIKDIVDDYVPVIYDEFNTNLQDVYVQDILDSEEISNLTEELITESVREDISEELTDSYLRKDPKSFISSFLSPLSTPEKLVRDTIDDRNQDVNETKFKNLIAEKLAEKGFTTKFGLGKQSNFYPFEEQLYSISINDVTLTEGSDFHFTKGSLNLVITHFPEFQPGKHTLKITFANPLTGEDETISQDFEWGVLAFNTDKDIYLEDSQAHISIGVLDDNGLPVCGAEVNLQVKTTDQENYTNIDVQETGLCTTYDSENTEPDYEATYIFEEIGTYEFKLTANNGNGLKELTALVDVIDPITKSNTNGIQFQAVIERDAATRLYPYGSSPMNVKIQSLLDFYGSLIERVPRSFSISDVSLGVFDHTGEFLPFHHTNYEIRYPDSNPNITELLFPSITLEPEETIGFSYNYNAPDRSPDFFTISPLEFDPAIESEESYYEQRYWNIANDAACTWTNGGGTGLWNNPANWSCGSVPGDGDTATINNGDTVTADVQIVVDTLTIGSTSTLNLNGNNIGTTALGVPASKLVSLNASGTLQFTGEEPNYTYSNTNIGEGCTGTFEFIGDGDAIAETVSGPTQFCGLTVNDTSPTPDTFRFSYPSPKIYGDVHIMNGIYEGEYQVAGTSFYNYYGNVTIDTGATFIDNGPIGSPPGPSKFTNYMGNFTNYGTYDHNGGAAQFNNIPITAGPTSTFPSAPNTQTIIGNTTFNILSLLDRNNNDTPANQLNTNQTIFIDANSTIIVETSLQIRGTDGDDRLAIESTVPGTAAKIQLGTSSPAFASGQWLSVGDVQLLDNNGDILSPPLSPSDSITTGNAAGWFPDFIGTLYTEQGGTGIPGKTIRLLINGADTGIDAETDANGDYSINVIAGGGDIVTLYVDDETENSVLISKFDGANSAGYDMFEDYLVVRTEGAQPALTNSEIESAVSYEGTHGGAVPSSTDISSIFTTSTGTGVDLTMLGNELLVQSGNYTPGGDVSVSGDLDIDGTITFVAENVNIGGDLDIDAAGTTTLTSLITTIGGDLFSDTGSTLTHNSGSIVLDGTSNQTITTSGNPLFTIQNSNSSSVVELATPLSVQDTFINDSSGIFNLNGHDLSVTGTFSNEGIIRLHGNENTTIPLQDVDSGVWEYTGDGDGIADTYSVKDFNVGGIDYYDVSFNSTDGLLDVFNLTTPLTVTRDWTLADGTFDTQNNDLTVNGITTCSQSGGTFIQGSALVTCAGDLDVSGGVWTGGSGVIDVNGDFNHTNGTFTSTSNQFTVAGAWNRMGGTYTHNSGTVLLDGNDQQVNGSTTFYNLTKTDNPGDDVTEILTLQSGTSQTIESILTLDGNDTDDQLLITATGASNATFNLSGALSDYFITNGYLAIEYNTITTSSGSIALIPVDPINSAESTASTTSGWFTVTTPPSTGGSSSGGGGGSSSATTPVIPGDSDGDGILDIDEDLNDDNDPTNDDTDGDGIPNYLDPDDDNDGVPTASEDQNKDGDPSNDDFDFDGIPNYLDIDDDNDSILTKDEDIDGDGDPTNDDTDGSGMPNYLDVDDDNDLIPTRLEDINGDGDPTNDDSDGDGIPNYLDPDDDNDGILTRDEDVNKDGDPTNDDTDGGGLPNYLDPDDDNDGILTTNEDVNKDGDPTNDDSDGDGIPNYLDPAYYYDAAVEEEVKQSEEFIAISDEATIDDNQEDDQYEPPVTSDSGSELPTVEEPDEYSIAAESDYSRLAYLLCCCCPLGLLLLFFFWKRKKDEEDGKDTDEPKTIRRNSKPRTSRKNK
ncbi:hypothetical protein KC717_03295 [Candidatus Dojkabacteria bacterium]|uniref:Uncharacterized protein n=1 Tax=Candidatus Dojkabacteria bacterium TaxID=2099670 RepID=A0A955RKR2_9BACT|nr:hypothetical protein [Candidatus Dojkabacteria bacterium]